MGDIYWNSLLIARELFYDSFKDDNKKRMVWRMV